jgi:hypothetical protein
MTQIIKNYSSWLLENVQLATINEKLKIKIKRGKTRRFGFTFRKGGSLTIDPMEWEQDIQTPEAEWDNYLAANEAKMMAKMSEASKGHWAELKADTATKGYAVVALEKFIETDPTYKWQKVFCDNEEGIRQEIQKIPKAPSGSDELANFNGINMPIEFPMTGPSHTFFDDNKWEPTADFESRFNTEVLVPLNDIASEMLHNPNTDEPKFFLKAIEVHTSCSRYRNTGPAEAMTFDALSKARNTAAKDYIVKKLAEIGILVDSDTTITQEWKGGNGDGSTGPNPLAPMAITRDGRAAAVAKEDARADFGAPIADKAAYDKFKYCIAGLEIVANTNWSKEPYKENDPKDNEEFEVVKIDIPTKEYGIGFFSAPKRIGFQFRLPKIEIHGKLWRKHSGKYKKGKNWGATKCPKWN